MALVKKILFHKNLSNFNTGSSNKAIFNDYQNRYNFYSIIIISAPIMISWITQFGLGEADLITILLIKRPMLFFPQDGDKREKKDHDSNGPIWSRKARHQISQIFHKYHPWLASIRMQN